MEWRKKKFQADSTRVKSVRSGPSLWTILLALFAASFAPLYGDTYKYVGEPSFTNYWEGYWTDTNTGATGATPGVNDTGEIDGPANFGPNNDDEISLIYQLVGTPGTFDVGTLDFADAGVTIASGTLTANKMIFSGGTPTIEFFSTTLKVNSSALVTGTTSGQLTLEDESSFELAGPLTIGQGSDDSAVYFEGGSTGSFTGNVTINSGQLYVDATSSLEVNGNINLLANTVPAFIYTAGSLNATSVELGAGTHIQLAQASGTFSSPISGPGYIFISGSVALTGALSYTGMTEIEGTLQLNAGESLPADSEVDFQGGALDISQGGDQTFGSITGGGNAFVGNNKLEVAGDATDGSLTSNDGSGSLVFDGNLNDFGISSTNDSLEVKGTFVGGLRIYGAGETAQLDEGLTITVSGPLAVGNTASQGASLTVALDTVLGSGTDAYVTGNIGTSSCSGCAASFGGDLDFDSGNLAITNLASVTVDGDLNLGVANGSPGENSTTSAGIALSSQSSMEVDGDTILGQTSNAAGNAAGTLTVDSTSKATLDGTVTLTAGSMTVGGSLTTGSLTIHTGALLVQTGGSVSIGGVLSLTGDLGSASLTVGSSSQNGGGGGGGGASGGAVPGMIKSVAQPATSTGPTSLSASSIIMGATGSIAVNVATTIAAPISGSGKVLLSAATTITAVDTYTGITTLMGGSLIFGPGGSLPNSPILLEGGTLNLSQAVNPTVTGINVGMGGGTIVLGGNVLTVPNGIPAEGLNLSYNTTLNALPTSGTVVTLIKNNGTATIGVFQNLPPGGDVPLTYNGVTYNFVVSYNGGSGEDLTLIYAPYVDADVDADRNGTIVIPEDTSNPANVDANGNPLPVDVTSAANPFVFWVNDGIDGNSDEFDLNGNAVQDDLQPYSPPVAGSTNCEQGKITCTRDLENFARLWLYTSGSTQAVVSGQIIVGLEWQSTSGSPAINVYAAEKKDGAATNTGGADYLTDPATAKDQVAFYPNQLGTVAVGTPFYFNPSTFAGLTAANPKSYFLFEGSGRGTGKLVVTLNTGTPGNYTQTGTSGTVYMSLKETPELYERWSVGDGPNNGGGVGGGGLPATTATIYTSRILNGGVPLQYSPTTPGLSVPGDPTGNDYILFVHGWNLAPWEKDAFAATALKRLYWQGYKGKLGTFQWPCTYVDNPSNWTGPTQKYVSYDPGEVTAWFSADPLEMLLAQLNSTYGSKVFVLAHSMGNVVTGEALRLAAQPGVSLPQGASLPLVNTYVATQAAVEAEGYDTTLGGSDLLNYGGVSIYSLKTTDIYGNWFSPANNAVTTKVNFYNINDYALGLWNNDQQTKPDTGYSYNSTDDVFSSGSTPLNLGTQNQVLDRYTIMAYAAQPSSRALGEVPDVKGFTNVNLQGMWPSDTLNQTLSPLTGQFTTGPYSSHPWHSAQFRFTNADQQGYWRTLLGPFGFNIIPLLKTFDFDQWAASHGASSDPTSSSQNDDIPDLLKYLYDIDPSVAMTSADRAALPTLGMETEAAPGSQNVALVGPSISPSANNPSTSPVSTDSTIGETEYLTLTYRQNPLASGLAISVQTSTDLKTWTTDSTPADQPQPTGAVDSVTGDPFMMAQVPVTATKQFIRLQVTMP